LHKQLYRRLIVLETKAPLVWSRNSGIPLAISHLPLTDGARWLTAEHCFGREAVSRRFEREVNRFASFAAQVAFDGHRGFDDGAATPFDGYPRAISPERLFDFELAEDAPRILVQGLQLLRKGFEQKALCLPAREIGVGGTRVFALLFGFDAFQPFGALSRGRNEEGHERGDTEKDGEEKQSAASVNTPTGTP
jgi:hypothetical protein